MNPLTRQLGFLAPAAVMAGWATVMLHTVVAGHINRLLSPMFRGYVLVAAILLLVMSVGYLLLYQPSEDTAAIRSGSRLQHGLRWLCLLLPLLAAAVLSPAALSNTTMANRAGASSTAGITAMPSMSAASAANVKDALAADPNQPVPVDVTDLITLSKSPDQMKVFDGRKVRAVGFVVPGTHGGSLKLLRWMMWCCAADAQPVSVALNGNLPGAYKDGQWYEVIGTAQFPATLGQVTPVIAVDGVKPTPEPDEPYLSP